jgi:hypothetical protein
MKGRRSHETEFPRVQLEKRRMKGKAQSGTKPEAYQICREVVMLPTCTIP